MLDDFVDRARASPIAITPQKPNEQHYGLPVVDRVETWHGSPHSPVDLAEVREWLRETARRYGNVRVVLDPHQAAFLTQELRRNGVAVGEYVFSPGSVHRLAVTLLVAIRDRALALPNDPELLRELARVRVRETSPNVLRIDHARHEHDDRAIAVALAATTMLERLKSPGPRIRTLGFR